MKALPPQSSVLKNVVGLVAVALCLVALPTGLARAGEIVPELSCPSCEDYNACTIDSCDTTTGTCRHDPLNCDDGNPCTGDLCYPYGLGSAGCRHPNLASGSACSDGDACTSPDACDGSGHCIGQPQPPASACDDGNPCTTEDACDDTGACAGTPLPAGTECDDTNACTRGERCLVASGGSIACQGTARSCDDGNPCTTDTCDPITDDCVNAPVNCDDANPCTDDACDTLTGACGRTIRDSGSCNDANVCTVNDYCSAGNCFGGGPWDCGWQCGRNLCIPEDQGCLIVPTTDRCPAGGECYFYECRIGICQRVDRSSTTHCNGGNQCISGSCTHGVCEGAPRYGAACDDGNPCTTGDICQFGAGVPCGGTSICSDGDACTDDLCDPTTVTCGGHTPKNCDDGNPCTIDTCNPATGCGHTITSGACNDNNPCTANDQCDSNGQCGGTLAVCPDDGNACTEDVCDFATGTCIHRNNNLTCSDGNPCTVSDFCSNGSCHSGSPRFCDDSNPCTEDSCDPSSGVCVHRVVDAPCSDGNACTSNDRCVSGTCTPGPPTICDDGNSCTADACSSFSGCVHTPLTGPCDDGNSCTTGDTCVNGVCRPTSPVSCIDGNPCTVDYCDRTTGSCVHEATAGDCVVDIRLSFTSPVGRGSGTLTWRTTAEATLSGFHILVYNQQDVGVPINPVLIPCTECLTGAGASYTFYLPKHRSGHNIFVQAIGRNGQVLGTFGPAQKEP
jgi:hypothetical protein